MSEIHLHRKHTIGLRRAKVAAQKVADEMAQSYGMSSEWDGNVLRFTRSGVEGTLRVAKDHIALDATLGFLLSAFRGRIEEHMNENFDRYFC